MDKLNDMLDNEFPNNELYAHVGNTFKIDVNDIPDEWFNKKKQILREEVEDNDCSIYPAKKEDADSIIDLDKQFGANSWKYASSFFKPEHSIYVAKDKKSNIVGYILMNHKGDSDHVVKMLVDKSKRNYGIGSKLLSHVESISDAPKITLNVRSHNDAAKQLYLNNGYSLKEVKPSYYLNGDDAHHMVKEI